VSDSLFLYRELFPLLGFLLSSLFRSAWNQCRTRLNSSWIFIDNASSSDLSGYWVTLLKNSDRTVSCSVVRRFFEMWTPWWVSAGKLHRVKKWLGVNFVKKFHE